ncbi:MAG: cell division protein CrgA [Actinomycetota bacterium]|nr:cell division protein CrgA [Actinomycetota bacterium]
MPESKGRPKPSSPAQHRIPKAAAPNPEWWVPVMVTLLLLGLAWIVTFYISQGAYPVAKFNYWNLVAGFGLLIGGFGMAMRWR